MPAAIKVSSATARRFMRRATLLDATAPDIATALAHHGCIQIDPINVCGRMHDLILRNRVTGYREGDLHRYVHSPARPAYEHYLPGATNVLVAYPVEAWPMLAARIHARKLRSGPYGRPLAPTHERLARHILDEIAARGPLTSADIEHTGRSRTGWGTPGRLVKNILEVLFVHGRVLISARRHFRRVYDLPERVLPAAILAAKEPSNDGTVRWLALNSLRQRRLVLLKKKELPVLEGLVQPVHVAGCPTLYCLISDLPLFDLPARLPGDGQDNRPGEGRTTDPVLAAASNREGATGSQQRCGSPPVTSPLLLAPLDPLIYDRRVTSALWGFDYTWEAYTPPSQRQRGYYALPVLAGTELIGHVDPKADRVNCRLQIVSHRISRGHKVTPAFDSLAGFLGLRR